MTDKTFVAYDMEIENADHQWSAFSSALSQIKTEFSETDSSNIADSIFEYANQIEDDSDGNKASIHPKVQAFEQCNKSKLHVSVDWEGDKFSGTEGSGRRIWG